MITVIVFVLMWAGLAAFFTIVFRFVHRNEHRHRPRESGDDRRDFDFGL